MTWRERMKSLPPDGTMPMATELKDFKSNIMVIKCPDHLRSPDDELFHLATVDRSVVSTNYSGNDIIDRLCSGLLKVKLPRREKPKTGSPPPLPPIKKYTGEQKDFHSTRRGNRFNSGSRTRSYHKNLRIDRPDKHWIERSEKSWIDRTDKFWLERPTRTNAAEISPWVEGKQPWNNGNVHVPIFDNVSRSIDFHEMVNIPVNDCFVPHKDTLPLNPDYPHTSGVFHSGPSPKYPTGKGLLGDHPLQTDPGCSYRNLNPIGDPLNTTFPSGSRDPLNNAFPSSSREPLNNSFSSGSREPLNNTFSSGSRDPGISNDYRRNPRGGIFQKNNLYKRKPFGRRRMFQNNERNSGASTWNGNEGARLNNRTRGPNKNRPGKSFNTGTQNYRPRKKY